MTYYECFRDGYTRMLRIYNYSQQRRLPTSRDAMYEAMASRWREWWDGCAQALRH